MTKSRLLSSIDLEREGLTRAKEDQMAPLGFDIRLTDSQYQLTNRASASPIHGLVETGRTDRVLNIGDVGYVEACPELADYYMGIYEKISRVSNCIQRK